MKNTLQLAKSCLAVASMIAAAYSLSGCGGTTYNSDSGGISTQAADPYVFSYQDNIQPNVASGLGLSSATGDPAASDTFFFTFALANSAPNNTLTGAGVFKTGIGFQGAGYNTETGAPPTFAPGTVIPAAPTSSTVQFRAEGAQGQTTTRSIPDITSVKITEPSGTSVRFAFEFDNAGSITGPFASAPYVANVTTPATSGVYAYKTTITDTTGATTTTTFEGVVLAPGYAAIASASALKLTLGAPTITYGPDSSGTTVLIFPAGEARVSVGNAATQLVQAKAGTVTSSRDTKV